MTRTDVIIGESFEDCIAALLRWKEFRSDTKIFIHSFIVIHEGMTYMGYIVWSPK